MRTVHRFVITADDTAQPAMLMPAREGEFPLAIGNAEIDRVEFWAEVDTTRTVPRYFQIFGTGHPVPEGSARYAGTAPRNQQGLVWHLFEVPEPRHA
jgi:hypothetical protein